MIPQSRISSPLLTFIILLTALINSTVSQLSPGPQFDNEIQGKPEIECGHNSIIFKVDTMKREPSAIYVKGNMENEECVFHNVHNASIPLHKCNMRKKREINPNGVAYSFTVVVQLHPLFITKVDRAYNVHCFYMETQKEHSVEIGVSDMAPTELPITAQLPVCTYSIHRDSPHGPVVRFAKVGEMLFHVWQCPSDVYAMLLHSCEATDGSGMKSMVIDDNGCAVEEYIMPQITYNDELTTGMVESAAYSFPDKTSMIFSCQIRLCFKGEDCSNITPPKCGGDAKGKIAGSHNDLEEDLNNEQLIPTSVTATTPSTTTSAAATTILVSQSPAVATSATKMPADFPRPDTLDIGKNVEGSGETLDSEDATTPTIQILKKGTKGAKAGSRSQRHSPPKPANMPNFDIQSPEITIIDDNLDPNAQSLSPTTASKQFYSEETLPKFNDKICVPLFGFYAAILFILFFSIVVLVFLFKSRKTLVHKFY